MNMDLKPWVKRPFELIFHAEVHYLSNSDYDRRLALISFDNSIEISIVTYLNLNPIQRSGLEYKITDVNKWMNNYHTEIDFFIEEIKKRGLPILKEKSNIIWYHDQRNEQYHGRSSGVPSKEVLDGIRQVAIWVFSVLFDIPDVKTKLNSAISQAEITMPFIPDKYVVPNTPDKLQINISQDQALTMVIATILGSWDEKNEGDREIIRKLTNGF